MNLSVTVITKNEAQRIEAMLESVRWADEIIVVDASSEDATVEIARRYAAQVVLREFTDFSDQKNYAQSIASNEWILNLDADEICSKELAVEIQALPEDETSGYFIGRKNYFQGRWIKHSGWSPDWKLRLYKKSAGVWKGRVHERLHMNDAAVTRNLKYPIEHQTYKDFDRYVQSIQQFSRLAAEQMKEQGRTAGLLDLVFRPPAAFLKKYFLQLGMLDGAPGFVISALTAYSVFCRYGLLREWSSDQ